MPLVVVLSLPFLVLLLAKPVLRRLAVRNASRRPREAMLILLGAMLGTAIITSSYVVGDTLRSSIRSGAVTKLGPIDELIVTSDPTVAAGVLATLTAQPPADTDGTLAFLSLDASVARTGPSPKAEPRSQLLEIDFAKARAFGNDPGSTGISGPTPGAGEAVMNEDLAANLEAGVGDQVSVFAYGAEQRLEVVRILPRRGIAGFDPFDLEASRSPNLFVPPGTIVGLRQAGEVAAPAAAQDAAPPTSIIAISNRGGVFDGVALTDKVSAELKQRTAGMAVSDQDIKRELLELADDNGKQFTDLFRNIGWFSVLAGILLLVNIFVMLAQERKTELGMLRAVGLRRSSLVGSFSLEGWIYALLSSVLGLIVGIGIGRVIVVVASGIFGGDGRYALDLQFAATAGSVQQAFSLGFAIALVTVVATSLSIARLNVIRAIRDLPEPIVERRSIVRLLLGVVGVVAGAALTVGGITAEAGVPALAGPAIFGLGLVPLLRRLVPARPLITVVSALVLAWAVVAFGVLTAAFEDSGFSVFLVQGVVLTAAAVALVTQNQSSIGAVVRRVGGGAGNMSLRLGLAYPLAKRFRTGLILSMYSLVVFTLTFVTVMIHLFSGQVGEFTRKVSGGASLTVRSNATSPVSAKDAAALPGVAVVAPLRTMDTEFATASTKGQYKPWRSAGFDESFIGHGAPILSERGDLATDADVYRAVLADPAKIVLSRTFLVGDQRGPPEAGPQIGDVVTMRDPQSGATRELHVAGVIEEGFGNITTLVSERTARELFGARASADLLYLTTTPGTDDEGLATSINGTFLANGADATSFRQQVNDSLARQQQFFQLIRGYLALGLLVGIAGLGVVMVRAVRERRREVGVLRSLGFSRVAVRRAFVAESAFIALEGIMIGAVLAVVTAWRTAGSGAFGDALEFSVPWAEIGLLLVVTFVASLLATAAPAVQASRIRPAVALRTTD